MGSEYQGLKVREILLAKSVIVEEIGHYALRLWRQPELWLVYNKGVGLTIEQTCKECRS
jgi:hypothetical protein